MGYFITHHSRVIHTILIAVTIVNLSLVVYPLRSKYLATTYWQRFPELKKTYLNSQYATKHAVWVRDEVAYAYAGGALIRGENPIYVIPDAPPLGKYLIGLSALLFRNEHMVSLLFGLGSLGMLYLLGKQVFNSSLLALLPPFFYSFEPLFKNQFVFTPLFDTMQLVFLLSSFIFFNKALAQKKYVLPFLLTSFFIGCFIATKFFVSGITIVLAYYLILFLHHDKKRLLVFTASLPLSIFVLLFSYVWVFTYGYHLREFLGIQKWIFLYHKGQLGHAFSIWPLLLINRWYVWFGNVPVLSDAQWLITWPIMTAITFGTTVVYAKKRLKQNISVEVLMAWVICYLLFFSIGQITTRYFIILLPILYLLSVYGLKELYLFYKKR